MAFVNSLKKVNILIGNEKPDVNFVTQQSKLIHRMIYCGCSTKNGRKKKKTNIR